MRKLLRFGIVSLLMLGFSIDAAVADGKPCPRGYICENFIATFSKAHFTFDVPDFQHPIEVDVTAFPPARGVPLKLKGIVIAYGDKKVEIGEKDVSDIQVPYLSALTASAMIPFQSDQPYIVLYVPDESEDCDKRVGRGCGFVEFDWDLRGKFEKYDDRSVR